MNKIQRYYAYICMVSIMFQLSAGEGYSKNPREISSMQEAQESWKKSEKEIKQAQQAREQAEREVKAKQQGLREKRDLFQGQVAELPGQETTINQLDILQKEVNDAQFAWKVADQNFKEQIQERENLINNPYVALYRENLKALTVTPETSEVPSVSPSRGPATGLNRIWRNMQKWWYERALQAEGVEAQDIAQVRAKLDAIYRDLGQYQNRAENRNKIFKNESLALSEEQKLAHQLRSLQLLEEAMRARQLTKQGKQALYNTFADTAVDLMNLRETLSPEAESVKLVADIDAMLNNLAQDVTKVKVSPTEYKTDPVAYSKVMKDIIFQEELVAIPENKEDVIALTDSLIKQKEEHMNDWLAAPDTAFSKIDFQQYMRNIRRLRQALNKNVPDLSEFEQARARLLVYDTLNGYQKALQEAVIEKGTADWVGERIQIISVIGSAEKEFVRSLIEFARNQNMIKLEESTALLKRPEQLTPPERVKLGEYLDNAIKVQQLTAQTSSLQEQLNRLIENKKLEEIPRLMDQVRMVTDQLNTVGSKAVVTENSLNAVTNAHSILTNIEQKTLLLMQESPEAVDSSGLAQMIINAQDLAELSMQQAETILDTEQIPSPPPLVAREQSGEEKKLKGKELLRMIRRRKKSAPVGEEARSKKKKKLTSLIQSAKKRLSAAKK